MALPLRDELHRRIGDEGRITFFQFMDLALYWPNGGYYRGSIPTGASGDFYTAPGAHPSFGGLICLQLYQMWTLLGRPKPFWVVEPGAGNGLLCHDIMSYARFMPSDFHCCLRYLCVDLRDGPGVEAFLPREDIANVHRISAHELSLADVVGCVVSNELLDAFPVHLVEKGGGKLLEVYVTLKDGEVVEELGEPSTVALLQRLDYVGVSLPEGQRAEVNLALSPWLRQTAKCLERGYILTIDYGREAAELYSPARPRGTLTTFYRHTQTDNPYSRLGEQDITAQVDFSALMLLGEELGLTTQGYVTQGQFLSNLGVRRWMASLPSLGLDQQKRDANRMGMLDLVRPGGMGDFNVLVQGRSVPELPLWGIQAAAELEELLQGLPVPLLTPMHMPLLQGRYPYSAVDFMGLGC